MLSAARLACEPLAESPWTLNTQVVTTHVKSYKFRVGLTFFGELKKPFGYGSIPINTIFSGMNIHLPAILGFTRGTRF